MEQLYLYLVLLFVYLTVLFFFILFYRHMSISPITGNHIFNLPPGKMGLPVIGESLEFVWLGWKGHQERFIYERMAKYSSKVFKTSIIGEHMVMFCGAACNKFLFSNENKLVMSWWPNNVNKIFPSTLQTSSKEEAKKLRHILPQFLSAQALQRYIGVMDTVAQTHFASYWENNTQVTVFPLAKRYTFSVACRLFMNFDDPKQVAKMAEPFNKVASGIISMPIDFPGTPFNRAIKASKFIREELLMNIIKQRKVDLANGMATPTQDILSHMLSSCDENGQYMTEHYIADKILGMLIGGHDTASSACAFIVKYLAELPQIYQNVYQLYWSASSTHKNPECFKEPDKFDPSRFEGKGPAPYTYVPFGGGPRMCPGKEYARMEILVFMHNLVKRFNWETVIPNENIIIDPMPVPAKGLPVRLYPHQA